MGRIFNSFEAAYTPCMKNNETGEVNYNICNPEEFGYSKTGVAFNDAYRYVDWLLTVHLLLIEIVLVMKLDEKETFQRSTVLGVSSALMIANGYPGETSGDAGTRWTFWALSMAPSATSCTPSSWALRPPRTPSPSACATRSVGHAGPPSSRGAPTQSCTPSQCSTAPRLASLACPPSPP